MTEKNKALDSLATYNMPIFSIKRLAILNKSTSESLEVFHVALANLVPFDHHLLCYQFVE